MSVSTVNEISDIEQKAREKKEKAHKNASKTVEEAKERADEIVKEAKDARDDILDQKLEEARKDIKAEKQQIISQAEKKANDIKEKGRSNIENAVDLLEERFRDEFN